MRGLTVWRVSRFRTSRGTFYGVYLTRWLFFTTYSFPGETRFYVRVGESHGWHFGGVRA